MIKVDLIYILSGGLTQNNDGSWRTTTYDDIGDKSGVLGDQMRIIATVYIAKENPNVKIIVSGGKGYQTIDSTAPELSLVMKQELVNLGISEAQITQDNKSNSSFEQLQHLSQIVTSQKVIVISNRYHLPRLEAMVQYFEQLKNLQQKNIEFISAEEIAILYDSKKWQSVIDQAYRTTEMKKRIASEQQGLKQIKDGSYKIN